MPTTIEHVVTTENVQAERRAKSTCPCGYTSQTGYADSPSARQIAFQAELYLAGAHLKEPA